MHVSKPMDMNRLTRAVADLSQAAMVAANGRGMTLVK
jgi:hypothetical protein